MNRDTSPLRDFLGVIGLILALGNFALALTPLVQQPGWLWEIPVGGLIGIIFIIIWMPKHPL